HPAVVSKVFGVGVSKAGTSTLHSAAKELGLTSVHWQHPGLAAAEIDRRIHAAIDRGDAPLADLPTLHDVDALFDIASVQRRFEAFDAAYPRSRFILHTRPLDSWLESNARHAERNRQNPDYSGDWTSFDRDVWAEYWVTQHERVRTYFRNRPEDLLEIDISAGDGWEKLAPFLGRPIPDTDFPHEFAASQRTLPGRVRAAIHDGRLFSGLERRFRSVARLPRTGHDRREAPR
ncbi:MAG: sulfotransferase, partial [Actinomycetota bacterium]